jgi:CRISPR-associated protein (TIGR03986 family)
MSSEYRFLNPYNFVRYLPAGKENGERDVTLLGRCTPPPHDRCIGLTGRIECELEAVTPIFISDSEFVFEDTRTAHKSFRFFRLRNEKGEEEFAIPSTSLRGMVRSVFEAATNSCFSVFEGGLLGKRERPEKYDRRLPLKAGMITNIPTSTDKNGIVRSMSYYTLPHKKFSQYKNNYEKNGEKVFVKIRDERVFDIKNKKDSGYIEGHLKTSDKGIPSRTQKRNEYVFVADSSSKDFILSHETYQNYIISNRNNRHAHTKVPKPGGTIWFRADEEKRIKEFGYAQIYRKPFKKSIGDLLPKYLHPCSTYTELCPACRVFGWVHQNSQENSKEKVAYAGRVKISHAKIIENNGTLPEIPLAILSTPKPTTTLFYLLKNGRADPTVAYDTDGAELRGRKFYRHQEEAEEQEYERTENVKDKQNRTIRDALKPGATFSFTIRFENLSPVELGALLWSVEMEEGLHHKLGLAKPLGFGSVNLSIINIDILDYKERYSSFTGSGWRAVNDQKKREWLDLFKAAMNDRYGKPFDVLNTIKDIKAILSAPPSALPVHYPRMSEEPDASGKNFEWFMKNKKPLKIASEDTEGFFAI